MEKDRRQSLGLLGEEAACAELQRRGYEVVRRRYRTRYGEIDIVARHGGVTVFVEVKTRDGGDYGDGAHAVTERKQRKVSRMALDYIARHRLHEAPCRFDVVAVDVSAGVPRVVVYPNAFDATE